MIHLYIRLLILWLAIPVSLMAQKEPVLVYGDVLIQSNGFKKTLEKQDLKVQALDPIGLLGIRPDKGRLLILGELIPPGSRASISRYVQAGGNLILIGSKVFDYRPRPFNPVSLPDFSEKGAYDITVPAGTPKVASMDKPRIETVDVPGTEVKGLQFSTEKRGMADVYARVSLRNFAASARSVLRFKARGNHYMDLLALRIKDTGGKTWLSFVPIALDWQTYTVSLADFVPQGWEGEGTYPLLDPAKVDSLALGVNLRTVWKEKPMEFAVGALQLTENETGIYAPTSALSALRLPFHENETRIPTWLVDPFIDARALEKAHSLVTAGPLFGNTSIRVEQAKVLKPGLAEFPGAMMGTDTKQAYTFRDAREKRRIPILQTSGDENIARLDMHAGGPFAGAAVGGFGLSPESLIEQTELLDVLGETAAYILRQPRIVSIDMNTTRWKGDAPVTPKFKVGLQNPTGNKIKGDLIFKLGGYPQKKVSVEIPEFGRIDRLVQFKAVPEDFSLADFDWNLVLNTDAGQDSMHQHVDVERAMLHAFIHLLGAQDRYPDGRYSNHYFGDAYGVRAMFAYLDYLERHPERLNHNPDLWERISPEQIRASAIRFCDMLVERQLPSGALPMGYSEHAGGYNVADAGQMAIALSQLSRYVKDPAKKQAYLNVVYRFFDWAEGFYIDQAKSDSLRITNPKAYKEGDARAGFYGLGQSGRSRRETGPSWVLSDILAAQLYLGHLDSSARQAYFRKIADRNAAFYVAGKFSAKGYYQAEALFWAWLTTEDANLRAQIESTLDETFLPPLYAGEPDDMYDLGGRATLKALPLLYYQELIENTPSNRAVLLKYIWSFASEDALSSMAGLSALFPKPVHGESLAAAKYAALSALWAMELLEPGSTLYKIEEQALK